MVRITVEAGDITQARVDAIVNAANPILLGGGGVDGAIHRAAGPQLVEACRAVPRNADGVRCPTGEARITPGFALPAAHVIHTVGPIYRDEADPHGVLAQAYRASLELAEASGVRTIAFPAISCGAYGFPLMEAARVAVQVARERDWDLDEIRFVLFTHDAYAAFSAVLAG